MNHYWLVLKELEQWDRETEIWMQLCNICVWLWPLFPRKISPCTNGRWKTSQSLICIKINTRLYLFRVHQASPGRDGPPFGFVSYKRPEIRTTHSPENDANLHFHLSRFLAPPFHQFASRYEELVMIPTCLGGLDCSAAEAFANNQQ